MLHRFRNLRIFQHYDAEVCKKSISPCSICAITRTNTRTTYEIFDFTDEVVVILQSIKKLTSGTTVTNLAELYRGINKKTKNASRAACEAQLAMFGRGQGCSEEDVQRLLRKLVIEGYLDERLEKNPHNAYEFCYVSVSKKGENFLAATTKPKVPLKILFSIYFCFQVCSFITSSKRKVNNNNRKITDYMNHQII